jgi:reactive intermediate/imine deaminase
MCAEGRRPLCQDTGIVNVFLKVGMDVRWQGFSGSLADAVNEGVRRGYLHPDNVLRASVVADPQFERKNTKDNTPAVIHIEIVPGDKVEVTVAAKGGGSENKSKFVMLNPSDSVVDWVMKTVPTMGAGWCPPGMLGIGIGGTAEKAMMMAKESLMEPLDMYELLARGPRSKLEELRIEIYEKVNALGIGAQGLGGLATVLDVKIEMFPTHAASKPLAMIPNCAATRHAHFTLDGSGPAYVEPPSLDEWPKVQWAPDYEKSRRVDLDTLTREEVASWTPGQTLLLSGKMLTGRDAAHQRISEMLARGEKLPVDFANRVIYYVGPVDPVRDEVVGPGRPHYLHPDGQVHRDDARADRPDRHDRQGRARTGRHRGHPQAQERLPDGGRRRGLPRVQGHPRLQGAGLRRPGHGSHLRVRGQGHAGDRGGRLQRRVGARDRTARMAGPYRQDPAGAGLSRTTSHPEPSMQIIETTAAPSRPKLFSQAIAANGLLFVSGQLPMRVDGTLAGPGIVAQAEQVMRNLEAILAAGGTTFAGVVKATVFLADLADFAAFNEVWGRHFPSVKPARSTVQVARLAMDALIEIEVVACPVVFEGG